MIRPVDWRPLLLSLCLALVGLPATWTAAAEPSEKELAAYADAANFQTNGALQLAIESWQKFLETYPDSELASKAAHYLGVSYMQQDDPDYAAAEQAFARALQDKDYELREESLANRGWSLYALAGEAPNRDPQRLKQALETFTKLRKEAPNSRFLDRALFYSGEAAEGLGRHKDAIDFYNRLLAMPSAETSPLRCDALYARGVAQEQIDEVDEAIVSFEQLLESCADDELATDVRLRLGDLRMLRQQYTQAIEAFQKAYATAEAADDQAYALFREAYALVQADQPAKAAEKYGQLLNEFPDSPHAAAATLAAAQSTYRSGDMQAAAERFRQVLQQSNLTAATEAAHWLARIELAAGNPEKAQAIAEQQLQAGAEGSFAVSLKLDLAEALSMIPERLEDSLQQFEQIYRDAPEDPLAPRALYNAAFSAMQLGRPEKAISLSAEFLEKFPQDLLAPDVRFISAESQLLLGNPDDAAAIYTELVEDSEPSSNQQRPLWVLRAAAALNAAGRYDETIELLGDELSQLPQKTQQAEAQFLLGQAHLSASRPTEAAEAFQASYQVDPQWRRADEARLLAGQALLSAGQREAATATWSELIADAPDSRMADQARYKLAQMSSADQQHEQAVEYYDQILTAKNDPPLLPYARYGKAWSLMQLDRYGDAVGLLDEVLNNEALKTDPPQPIRSDALLARGISLRNLGRLQQAQQDLEGYLATDPRGISLGHALYELALLFQQEEQPAKAAELLSRLVTEVPSYPSMDDVLYELGWSLREAGQLEQAVTHFTRLIEEYPQNALVPEAAYFVGQQHYRNQRWQAAAEQFEIVAETAQDAELAEKSLYRLGWTYFKADELTKAEEVFLQLAEEHPDGVLALDAWMMVGESRFKRGNFAEALSAYETARQRIRQNDDRAANLSDSAERQVRALVLLHGGQSAAQLERWDEAIGWYDELRERFPATDYLAQVFYELGFAYQQQGNDEKALKFFGEVANNYRNTVAARARFMMGEIHFGNREFDQAISEFQRVMFGFGAEKAPAAIQNWQAKSGFEAGRVSELLIQNAKTEQGRQRARQIAREFYEYVIDKHPQHELADEARARLEDLKSP